jgi:PTS system mannose-specific IIB component
MNLPMVIEAYASRLSMNTAREIAAHISGAAKEGVKIRPEELEPVKGNSETPAHQSNTGAPGKLKYVLARIDSRLLHGQISTAWTKATQPTRIIIVSDAVARDDLRKKLIQQAAPPGVKAHVSPANQMIKLTKDDRHFGGQRALLLFENPQDVVRAVNGGVPLNKINTGSMAHSPGKVQPNKVLAFSQERKNTIVKIYVVDQAGNKSKPTRVKIN